MDLALDILDNTLFVKTDNVISAFKKWIEENDLVDKINNEEVLMIYEPQSSIMNVLTELRNTLTEITISDSKWIRSSKLEMDNDKPKDSTLISLYLKKEESKYYKDNKKWTDIIYIEDNVGTGNQAINKIYALKKHLEDAILEDVNIYYWSYYVADIEDIKEKLRAKQLPEDAIVYYIDLRDYGNINNKIVWINDLLDKKYADDKDILLEKLKKLSLRISLSRKPLEWVRENNQWWLGWGGLGLLVVFEYGTPNNTIPILWRDSDEYFSLFPRPKPQEKNTVWGSVKDIIERFGGKV